MATFVLKSGQKVGNWPKIVKNVLNFVFFDLKIMTNFIDKNHKKWALPGFCPLFKIKPGNIFDVFRQQKKTKEGRFLDPLL